MISKRFRLRAGAVVVGAGFASSLIVAPVGSLAPAAAACIGTPLACGVTTAQGTGVASTAGYTAPSGGTSTPSASKQAEYDSSGGDPRIAAYWTQDRMAAAVSADQPSLAGAQGSSSTKMEPNDSATVAQVASTTGSEAATAGSVGTTDASTSASKAPRPTVQPTTVGKLFFYDNYYHYERWCTASTINTSSGRQVVTAGHCVNSGGGHVTTSETDTRNAGSIWNTNFEFVPDYAWGGPGTSARAPLGIWQPRTVRTTWDWYYEGGPVYFGNEQGWQYDQAVLTMYGGGRYGQTPAAALGANGYITGGPRAIDVNIFGYPENANSGRTMWACWGTTTSAFDFDLRRLDCNFKGGSSGGPWLRNFSNATGLGQIAGLMSLGDTGGQNYSPILTSFFVQMLNEANSRD